MLTDVAARIRGALTGDDTPDKGSGIERERVHAKRDDDVVVFVVGMRINAFWKLHRWVPVFLVAPRLVKRLRKDEDSGLLESWTFVSPPRTVGFVQYWESFDAVRDYARDSEHGHVDVWQDYNDRADDGAIGIWHETYRTDAYETVYNDVPPRGLGSVPDSELVAATGRFETADGRLSSTRTRAESDRDDEPTIG